MNAITKKIIYSAVTFLVVSCLAFSSASATMIYLNDNAQGQGNKGVSFRPSDGSGGLANFVMTARSSIDSRRPFVADARGLGGTVFIDKKGAGVQTARKRGSTGISGSGRYRDEELIFTYDAPVYLNSLAMSLNDIDFGKGACNRDDPVIFLSVGGSGNFGVIVKEAEILAAFTSTGKKTGVVNFSKFTSLSGDSPIDAFKIRETNSRIYVNGASTGASVPEPSTMAVLGLGGVLIFIRRKFTA